MQVFERPLAFHRLRLREDVTAAYFRLQLAGGFKTGQFDWLIFLLLLLLSSKPTSTTHTRQGLLAQRDDVSA